MTEPRWYGDHPNAIGAYVAAKHHIVKLYGLLRRKGRKPASVEAMDEAICHRFKAP